MSRVAPRFFTLGVHRRHMDCFVSHLSSRRSFRWRIQSITTPPIDRESRSESTAVKDRMIRSFALDEMLEEFRDTQSLGSRGEGLMLSVLLAWILSLYPPINLFGLMAATGWLLVIGGIVLFASEVLRLGRNNFPLPYPSRKAMFVRKGIYAHVRHPQYGGILLVSSALAPLLETKHGPVSVCCYGLQWSGW